ncbi:MAG TPA: OmpA family protein [Polyangiaceae bacterium]|nr:OmpA family protein [Polyangiaceae bacterium]
MKSLRKTSIVLRSVLSSWLLLCSWLAHPVAADPVAPVQRQKDLPPLKVQIDKAKVDLEAHQLEVKMSRKAGRIEITVYDFDMAPIAEETLDFSGRPAGATLLVRWKPKTDEPVGKIELMAYDAYDYYTGVQIVPWQLSIPHEDVTFATNSAKLEPEQEPKLEEAYKLVQEALVKHKSLGQITLFIAGHTDTMGSDQHNLDLSRQRALAIAAWFRKRGLGVSIMYAGFGEHSQLVKTEDEIGEPRNRRVDYVLSVELPRYKTSNRIPPWRKL